MTCRLALSNSVLWRFNQPLIKRCARTASGMASGGSGTASRTRFREFPETGFRRVRNGFPDPFPGIPGNWSGSGPERLPGPVSGNSRKVVRNGVRRVRNGFRRPFPGIPGKWSGTPSGRHFRPETVGQGPERHSGPDSGKCHREDTPDGIGDPPFTIF